MKKYLLICFTLFLIGISACGGVGLGDNTASPNINEIAISLNLELDKDVYEKGEPIRATLSLVNQGKNELTINSRMALNHSSAPGIVRDLEFIIISPSNQRADFKVKVNVVLVADTDFIPLSSGSFIQEEYNLEKFYTLNEAGVYSVYAIYENQLVLNNNHSVWKGKIESNKVEFEIK